METKFGPVAQEGDYVIVVDFNWMKRKCNSYIGRVCKGMAYTGMKNYPHDGSCVHKKKALAVIPESYVDEEVKTRIQEDIERG